MARPPQRPACPRAASGFFFLLLLVAKEEGVVSEHPGSAPAAEAARAMILPLDLRAANSALRRPPTEGDHFGRRRQRLLLQRDDDRKRSARLRLYDDLLTHGYYTTKLLIGTPPQEFSLIVDSGSTVTYVPCSTCEHCGIHQDPRFQPDKSSTYEPVKCNADCSCDGERNQCIYDRQYAERSTSSGVLGEDVISFGNESTLTPQRAVFGCENSETGDLFSQHADGIMGLGRGPLSVMDQLVKKGVIGDSFSLCYGGMGVGGGAMVLGEISPPPGMVFSDSDSNRSPYYNLDLKEIRVAGKKLPLNARIFNGKYGTILDSGTTYAYLPTDAFLSFRDAVTNHASSLRGVPGPDPNYKDICFSGAGSDASRLSETFPEVDMVFGNGQKLLLSPENYLFRHSKMQGAYCLGVFNNENDLTTLLGGIVVRNTLVMYDRAKERVGFWKTNCSRLSEKFQFIGGSSSPTPAPAPAYFPENSTTAPLPVLAPTPSGSSELLPGKLKVGIIAFVIRVGVNKSELAPHTSELAESIARDLEVNVSQVTLESLESEGRGSLIRWRISPLASADYFSHEAAVGIIDRLIEHRVRLPDNFGTYQLVGWNAESPSEGAWWKWHLVAIVGGGLVVFAVLSLSAFLFWRRRQEQTVYEPVGAAAEQELQPL